MAHITRRFRTLLLVAAAALAVGTWPASVLGQLKINEVFYNVSPQGGNQFVELLNSAATNVYLDGLVLTDEAGFGTEGVFQFPGTPGGTNFPVGAGARVIVAVDATGTTATADWECYAGGADPDNPAVSNLVRVGGVDDLGFAAAGDNCILASGTDTSAPLDPGTIIDGVNMGDGGGELALMAAGVGDQALGAVAASGLSLGRCLDGADSDYGSAQDFFAGTPSMDASNVCAYPRLAIADSSGPESNSGTNLMTFRVTLSPASTSQVSVLLFSLDGTATADLDYRTVSGAPVVFNPGVTSVLTDVAVLGDTLEEGHETFFLRMLNPTNGIVVDGYAQGLILDEEWVPGMFTSSIVRIRGFAPAITTEWNAVSGRTYQVQVGTTLMTPIWTDLGGVVTALSTSASAVDTSGAVETQRFYRILQLD